MNRTETVRRLKAGQTQLSNQIIQRLDLQMPWYRALPPADKNWVAVVANSGISAFIDWYEEPGTSPLRMVSDIFKNAPRELVRSVSLQHTLQLLRVVVGIVEERVPVLARPQEHAQLHEAVLLYSREIAFSAADVYARAAEARQSWDLRLEALVVDALVRGDSVDELASRSAAFGWRSESAVTLMLGQAPRRDSPQCINIIRRRAKQHAEDALVGVHADRLLIVLGGTTDEAAATEELSEFFGPGSVVIGPTVPSLAEAGISAASALWALRTAGARSSYPRPVHANDLLPERAMAGDKEAVRLLVTSIFEPIARSNGQLLRTAATFVEAGSSLEATARALEIHSNTVRYRLKKTAELINLDPNTARGSFVLRTALVYGHLSQFSHLWKGNKNQSRSHRVP